MSRLSERIENFNKVFNPRDCIKEAFNMNILPYGQIWIDMSKDRNLSAHEYNMEKVNTLLERISADYYTELCRFKKQTGNFNG